MIGRNLNEFVAPSVFSVIHHAVFKSRLRRAARSNARTSKFRNGRILIPQSGAAMLEANRWPVVYYGKAARAKERRAPLA
jgi:hypothetical protein